MIFILIVELRGRGGPPVDTETPFAFLFDHSGGVDSRKAHEEDAETLASQRLASRERSNLDLECLSRVTLFEKWLAERWIV